MMNLQLFAEPNTPVEPTGATGAEQAPPQNTTPQPLTQEMVEKMIQSATDKVRTDYSGKLKAVEAEKEEIIKKQMSEDEKRQYELDQLQKQLQEKEQAITHKEMTIKTVDLLKANDMPIEFRDFITATSEEELTEKITKLKALWSDAIKTAVQGTFQAGGREPQRNISGTMTEIQKLEDAYNNAKSNAERIQIKQMIWRAQNTK